MREVVHVLLGDLAVCVPAIQPSLQASVEKHGTCWEREALTPSGDVCDRVFTYVSAGEVFFDLASVFSREMELEHAVDAEDFVLETIEGD